MADDTIEREWWAKGKLVCGLDEAGVGCFAGSLFTAGVIFPLNFDFSVLAGLNDSKQLSESKRFELEPLIKQFAQYCFVESAGAEWIDKTNVNKLRFGIAENHIMANLEGMPKNFITYMDGNIPLHIPNIECYCLVKGDTKVLSIAAASVLAKCAKDREAMELDKEFPQYDWAHNKGYGSPKHIAAIEKFGLTPYHRRKYCKNVKIGE